MPVFKNSFLGALPPTVSQTFFWAGSFPADINGPTSAAICTSCLVGDDFGNCPTSSSSFLASSLHLSISPGEGGLLCHLSLLAWASGCVRTSVLVLTHHPVHPPLGVILILALLEWKINQTEVLTRFFEDVCHFFPFTKQVQRFQVLFYKWQMSGTTFHTFWRGRRRRRNFRQPWEQR